MNTKKFITDHLQNLGIKKKDNILVYSNLSGFGITDKSIAKIVLSSLLDKIGKQGSLVMPLYTFEKKNHFYDKRKIYLNSMTGLLNKEFFKKKGVLRSGCPIHSHIGFGKKVNFLKNSDYRTSFGGKSDFYYFYKNNYKLILLGCSPQEGATYLHHLEAVQRVKYRKWIKLKRKVHDIELKKTKLIDINFFALKKNSTKYDLNKFFEKIKKKGARLKIVRIKYGKSFSISIKNLHKYSLNLLKINTKSLLKK